MIVNKKLITTTLTQRPDWIIFIHFKAEMIFNGDGIIKSEEKWRKKFHGLSGFKFPSMRMAWYSIMIFKDIQPTAIKTDCEIFCNKFSRYSPHFNPTRTLPSPYNDFIIFNELFPLFSSFSWEMLKTLSSKGCFMQIECFFGNDKYLMVYL